MAMGPQGMGMPPMGSAPMAGPTANPGLQADALTKVNEAINLLSMALPNLQPGTEAQKNVLNSIQSLSKIAPASEAVPGVQQSTLRDLGQQAEQSSMMQALMRQAGSPGAQAGGVPPIA